MWFYLCRHSTQRIGRGPSRLFDHTAEESVFVFQQTMRMIEFHHRARVHDEHLIGVHDGVQTVSDRQYRTRLKFIFYSVLYQRVRSKTTSPG